MANYNSSNIKILEYDALIIGGGGSGMRASADITLAATDRRGRAGDANLVLWYAIDFARVHRWCALRSG